MIMPTIAWALFAAVGLCVGSYSTTAALRMAEGRSSTFGRSRCDHCGEGLSFARTVPVVSFVLQKGRCAHCRSSIDQMHLAGEIAGAVVLVSALISAIPLRAGLLSIFGLTILSSAVHDAKTLRLPDRLTIVAMLTAMALAATRSMEALWLGLIAGAVSFAMLEAVRRIFLLRRGKAGLGFGDVKFLAAIAIWTGLATPWVVIVAALIGLTWVIAGRRASEPTPFGPSIAVAAWIVGIGTEAGLWPSLA